MKVNFDFNLVDPATDEELKTPKIVNNKPVFIDDEKVYEPVNAIPLLEQCIVHPAFVKSDYIKHTELRTRIIKEKEFDIDKSDFDLIKSSVECEENTLFPLLKGIILLKFRDYDIKDSLAIKQKQDEKQKENEKQKEKQKEKQDEKKR